MRVIPTEEILTLWAEDGKIEALIDASKLIDTVGVENAQTVAREILDTIQEELERRKEKPY